MRTIILVYLLVLPGTVGAYFAEDHVRATKCAVENLPPFMPTFFRNGQATIAHCSVDPDAFKFSTDDRLLYRAEYAEHFFDLELFDANELPADRTTFSYWALNRYGSWTKVGLLPYALSEWTYRLSIALAEHRKWPDDLAIQAKCLVYAGNLAHYAQDLCQPLHTTIHYDGRLLENGKSPQTGIHAQIDGLLTKVEYPLPLDPNDLPPMEDLLPAILAEIKTCHQYVETVYDLEPNLPTADQTAITDANVALFAQNRLYASAHFTARLYVTAWYKSTTVVIPTWHQR